MDAKKKGGLLIALMGKPKKEPETDSEAPKVAAQAVLDAIEGKDPDALADAMRSMVAACSEPEDY